MTAPVSISVVVCAYTLDRLEQLTAAITSARTQLHDSDDIIVVIDHNDELFEQITPLVSEQLRVVPNDHAQGLSGARNTGVAASTKDIVVFIDDDAVCRSGSLEALRSRFQAPNVHAIGGAVHPTWEGGTAPPWFPPEFGWVVGCDYTGLPDHGAAIRNPIGAAMACRRQSLLRAGGFVTELGRVGTLPAGCEETAMGIAIRREIAGATIVRDVDFAVDHFVPRSRQTRKYFTSRCLHEGRSKAVLAGIAGTEASLSSEKAYVLHTLTRAVAAGIAATGRGDAAAPSRLVMLFAGLLVTAWGMISGRLLRTLRSSRRRSNATTTLAPTRTAVREGELVSAVIPSIGRDTLADTVQALLSQDYSPLEVIVVDNSPHTGRVQKVLQNVHDERLTIVAQPIKGVSAARNAGIAHARGTLIAFTDDDANPMPDWIGALIATFVADHTNTVHAVTGRVVGIDMDTIEQQWFEKAGVFDKGETPLVWTTGTSPLVGTLGEAPDSSVFFPYTCGEVGSGNNVCLHRSTIDLVGGFDEVLGAGTPTRGGEDLDMFRRILEAGCTIVYQPKAVVGHHHRPDMQALSDQMFGYGVGMSAVLTKLAVTGALIPVLQRVPAGGRYLLRNDSDRNAHRPESMPRSLVWTELRGYIAGPAAYAQSSIATVIRTRRGAPRAQ
ncbi:MULTISPECIES: glycosyltransferase family 2 protein [Actinomycetes]|uniref:glycosyltransferase family 2 protein n=1 Tax=Actinomycetes TaxID=1760 RepID=UPI0004C1CC58|nr:MULTISPECIES: glycosyltransferase family 2 protein [Actinomycetes]